VGDVGHNGDVSTIDRLSDTDIDDPKRPWHLRGSRAPISDEVTLEQLRVVGQIPTDLDGMFVRNGANPVTGVSPHWFFGNGMLHGVRLRGGKAEWYRNRYVRTPLLADPNMSRIDMSNGAMDRTASAANTHVISHAGRIMALEEGSFPWIVDNELETVGYHNYDGKLTTAMTAHPKVCAETGELLFFGYDFMEPYFTYHRVGADGTLVQSEPVAVKGSTMQHDFAVSRNHIIVMDLPVIFDLNRAIAGDMPMVWSDDYGARFGVFRRDGSAADVKWFDIDPCYVFHTMNAHDDGDIVEITGCRYNELWRDSSQIDGSTSEEPAKLHRWRLNTATGSVEETALDDAPAEFPRCADDRVGINNQFGYVASATPGQRTRVIKYDLTAGTSVAHQFAEGHEPGEPVFVPRADATTEDDGYLLTYVHAPRSSYLVVLDARDPSQAPVAEVHTERRIPLGFHGSWVPSTAVALS
jgi:carotenoid cleavage dioxygenase-like enzyme